MQPIDGVLAQLGYRQTHYVAGRASIADLVRPKQRCGIYVLHFADGWFYAGQAVDVVRRYNQHRKTHNDIERISFKRVAATRLNNEERRVIGELERAGLHLRNISLVSVPHWESDFDAIMPPEDQARWCSDMNYVALSENRLANPELRRRYRLKFDHLLTRPNAASAIRVLHEYVHYGVPSFRDGEMAFWSCSCLPGCNPGVEVYSRININWQEVFTVGRDGIGPFFSWHLALSTLEKAFRIKEPERKHALTDHFLMRSIPEDWPGQSRLYRALRKRYPSIELYGHHYVPGGADQVNICLTDADEAIRFIHDPDTLPAIRTFNLRLCQKGPCTFSRYHCLDLADRLVE